MVRRPHRRSWRGQEATLEVREGSGTPQWSKSSREASPDVWEGLGSSPGVVRGVGRSPLRSGRGQEAPRKSGRSWEAPWRSGRGREAPRRSGRGWEALCEVQEGAGGPT